jgi:membrane fusion protein, multidrug efflux system
MRPVLVPVAVVAVALVAAALWWREPSQPAPPARSAPSAATSASGSSPTVAEAVAAPMRPAPPPEAAATPAPAAVEPGSDAPPIRVLLVPRREATIVSEIIARVVAMPTTLGATVRAGEPLVRFDCSEQKAKLDMASAEMDAAREAHAAKLRLQGLQSAGELEVTLAAAARDRAKGALDLAETQHRACTIAAPFSGRVVKLSARPHQSVTAGQTLLEFVSADPPRLRLNVPSRWLRWIRPGSRFDVAVDETGRTYQATVAAINGRVDAVSQSVEIEADVVESDAKLLAGMSGTARFPEPAAP